MNIVFINPPSPKNRKIIRLIDCSHEAKADYLWQPSDFMAISSLLSPSDSAALVDGTADGLDGKDFFEQLSRLRPDLVFFALSGVCWESDYQYFLRTRELFKTAPFYVIGDIFQESEYLSFILGHCSGVVVNPFLLDMGRMAQAPAARDPHLPGVRTVPDEKSGEGKQVTFINGNYPRHELFLKKGYRFPFARHFRFSTVTTMWGCPFACFYCPDSQFSPIVRAYRDVLRELEYLNTLGIQELFFGDKTFGYPQENAHALLREMVERFRFSWTCYMHPQLYEPKLLELMKLAGCHTIITGIDSADVASLEKYGRRVEKEKIERLVYHADRLRMSVCGDFIIGLEHEREEDILNTIRYALQLPLDFASFNIAAPLPGSSIRQKASASGRMVFGREGYDTLTHRGDLGINGLGYDEIRRLRNKAVRSFYLRPSYLMRRLKKTTSAEHFLIQLRQMLVMFRKIWR